MSKDLMAAVEKLGDAAMARIAKVEAANTELRDRLEAFEAAGDKPGQTSGSGPNAAQRAHRKAFEAWIRKPFDGERRNELSEIERRAVNITTGADGGHAVPSEIAREIERHELKLSPVRRLVKVMQVGTSDFKHLLDIRGATAGWVGEFGSRSETSTPSLRERVPTMGEIYAYPQTTEWALDDVFFDVAAWLAESVADEFALLEGDAVIRGDGSNKPTGFLNTAPSTAVDGASPLRDAAALQYIDSPSGVSPAVYSVDSDKLIDLQYELNAKYRSDAVWVMNSATAGHVRKLKDSEGRYLWQPSFAAGQPPSLLGHAVEIWEQMDDVGSNAFPIAFGNFRRGYLLAERTQIRITIDANITTPGRIKYFVRRREGGAVLNNDAVKLLRTSA